VPIVMTQDMPGATRELVDEVTAELQIELDRPRGLIVHTAAETAEGVRIVDVWETEADFHRFEDGRLRPALAAVASRRMIDLTALPAPRQTIYESFETVR
jgi:hypothetical protein